MKTTTKTGARLVVGKQIQDTGNVALSQDVTTMNVGFGDLSHGSITMSESKECAMASCTREAHPVYTTEFVMLSDKGPMTSQEMQREIAKGNTTNKHVCVKCHRWARGVDMLWHYTLPAALLSFIFALAYTDISVALIAGWGVACLSVVIVPIVWRVYLRITDPNND